MKDLILTYSNNLAYAFNSDSMLMIEALAIQMKVAWETGQTIYLCGNGGSAGSAPRMAFGDSSLLLTLNVLEGFLDRTINSSCTG